MQERPILMNAEMVKALLAGRKTQTRRVMKSQPYTLRTEGFGYPTKAGGFVSIQSEHCLAECPYGKPGDRLWVRETWQRSLFLGGPRQVINYRADFSQWDIVNPGNSEQGVVNYGGKISRSAMPWRPSIHMPRWASRITLEITEVRVQRLQEISEDDARDEGADPVAEEVSSNPSIRYRAAFLSVWCSINGVDAWSANPWVWAITFKVL